MNGDKNQNWLFAFAVLAMITVIVVIGWPGRWDLLGAVALNNQDMANAAAGTVGGLLVIALLVERSMAVINALVFGDGQRKADLALRHATDADARSDAEQAVRVVMQKKERLRLLLGFGVALFISAAGIRTLQNLVVANPDPAPGQLFYGVDIVLTAGLIAGGSNGLAYLLELLKSLANKTPPQEADLRTRMVSTS